MSTLIQENGRVCNSSNNIEYFPSVPKKVPYLGPESMEPLSFRYYNPDEIILGKPMKEWLRFSVCYWHTFCWDGTDQFGNSTFTREWLKSNKDDVSIAKLKCDAAFEFFQKIGAGFYSFHERDLIVEQSTLEETNKALDEIIDYLKKWQDKTGIKVLFATQNLFTHARYKDGAFTNPNAHVVACAAAQAKKVLDISKKLEASNIVFWGGREGFQSYLNTSIKREVDHMATMFQMVVDYKQKHDIKSQLLIEPKPCEPLKHLYDYDARTVIGFLKQYGLDEHFKLNIEPNHSTLAGHDYEHDIIMSKEFGMLGNIDINSGDPSLGWDVDYFLSDIKKATSVMLTIIEIGGLNPGGLNFDCKVRRESTDENDLFIAHVNAMDTMAKGLRIAAKIHTDGVFQKMVKDRYNSFDSGFGKDLEDGKLSLDDCEDYVKKEGTDVELKSGQQELYEMIFSRYCF